MSDFAKQTGLAVMTFARQMTEKLLREFPQDRYFYQPFPNANHALWIIGHVTTADDYFLSELGGREKAMPPEWHKSFGMGSTPETDPSVYPTVEALKAEMVQARKRLIEWIQSMGDEQLQAPLPDDWKAFAPTHAALMGTVAWHEGHHAGQLTVIQKSLKQM